MKQIKTLKKLKKMVRAADGSIVEGFISFGIVRSSKDIYYNGRTIMVNNLIDDSTCRLEHTNIPEAVRKGAFYLY